MRPSIASRLGCALLVMTAAVWAQPQPPRLQDLSRDTIQRGAPGVEIVVRGQGLDAVGELSLPDAAGLIAEIVSRESKSLRLRISAGAEAPVGKRELRVVAPSGVSNPLTLHVSQYPPVQEMAGNDALSQPQDVQLPAVVLGAIHPAGDTDYFRFEAAKGQHLVVEVVASREGSPLDPVIALYNAAGREVASNNDHFEFDSFLTYQAPSDGVYTLSIRDLRYRGGPNYRYRITAGPIPYIEAVYPLVASRGSAVEVQAVGYNLPAGPIHLPPGAGEQRSVVRVNAGVGESNSRSLEWTGSSAVAEREPNNAWAQAQALTPPILVSGRIDRPGDMDLYRFELPAAGRIAITVQSRRFGSAVDPLLVLRDAQGAVLARQNDAEGGSARLVRDLDAGSYSVSVEDLLHSGGPAHVYLLSVGPDAPPPQDFAVFFQPDAVRISRGGHARLWCEIGRANNYSAPITLEFEGLPPGVSLDPYPVVVTPDTSGLFTLAASGDAPLGTFPVKLIAKGELSGETAMRDGRPQIGATTVQQAYVTILDAAPFALRPEDLTPQQIQAYSQELAQIETRLATPDDGDRAQAVQWEQSLADKGRWTTLEVIETSSEGKASFFPMVDGSVLVGGQAPAVDRYSISARTGVRKVTALQIEALSHESLPGKGPGRGNDGNFVLTYLKVAAAPADDSSRASDVAFHRATQDFAQLNLATADKALEEDRQTGWAVGGATGQDHWAIFEIKEPLAHESGTVFTIRLDQLFGGRLTLGRFRLSVTGDTDVKPGPALPGDVVQILSTPSDQRTPQQRDALAVYSMSTAEQYQPARARAAVLRSIVGPALRVDELQRILQADSAEIDAAQAAWEANIVSQAAPILGEWHHVGPFQASSMDDGFNSAFAPETEQDFDANRTYEDGQRRWERRPQWADGTVHNPWAEPNVANFLFRTIEVAAPRQLNLSLGSDDGVKLWVNGELVLARNIGRAAAADQEKVTVTLNAGTNRLLMKIVNGGGLSGFYFKAAEGLGLPAEVLASLKTPASERSEIDRRVIRDYYRLNLEPSLRQTAAELAEARTKFASSFPPRSRRQQVTAISVALQPLPGFTGPVTLSLEGFASGRDAATAGPVAITEHIDFKPLTLSASESIGILSFTPKETCQLGTRMVVLRGEAEVEGVKWVQYSPAFPLTVTE